MDGITNRRPTRLLLGAFIFCAVFLSARQTANAESITLTLNSISQGTFGCSGANGCYGNDVTLDVSGSGTNWAVTLNINTAGNTNGGDSIAAVSFILTGFNFSASDTNLILAPGGAGGWTEAAGPASAGGSGCNNTSSNSVCAYDTSLFAALPSGNDAKLSPASVLTWKWTVTNQTFSGFDDHTHIQALFGRLIESGTGCPGGASGAPCYKESGLMSTSPTTITTPEPVTLSLLGFGLVGVGAAFRKHVKRGNRA